MGTIIFYLLLILINFWIIFDKDTPNVLKSMGAVSVILLVISIVIHVYRII